MRTIEIYRQLVPEHYVHNFGITIHSKKSEISGIEYDLLCILYDCIKNHPQFGNVNIVDLRGFNLINGGKR
jgi:hypothetical protein